MRHRLLRVGLWFAVPLLLIGLLLTTLSLIATPLLAEQPSDTRFVATNAPTSSAQIYLPLLMSNAAPNPPAFKPIKFGVDFISQAEALADEVRYQRAAGLNATINRWPLYWSRIEQNPLTQPGVFNWAAQDANVVRDIQHGLAIDAILLGTPAGLSTGGSLSAPEPRVGVTRFAPGARPLDVTEVSAAASAPQGLYLSVFSDGTDTPGAGKSINANNRWALFVNAAVARYKPGGTLAQQQGWTSGQGITVWEVWNEPDLNLFWTGTITDYARLLKVAFLAARQADPQAQILFGGLCNCQQLNWLRDTLNIIATYPDRAAGGWFFNSVATHNYSWAWYNFYQLFRARQSLDLYGLADKTLWLNETGAPVYDDPAVPITKTSDFTYRATMLEQADYAIQTAAFAVWMRAEAMLWFQLYDDFGNGCPGIDAFGLVRNTPTSGCNASDGSTRPGYTAYQVATRYLSGLAPYWRQRPTAAQELVALQNNQTGERVIAMWARSYVTETVVIAATWTTATLVYPNGSTQTIAPVGSAYTLMLPAATNTTIPTSDGYAGIGGSPRILIERDPAVVITLP